FHRRDALSLPRGLLQSIFLSR
ncbi:unnamed protein product, partial [Allacma fusca]